MIRETTIKIRQNIKDKLKKLKIHPKQPYDEVIEKLIKEKT